MKDVRMNTPGGRMAASIFAVALLLLDAVEATAQTRIQIPKGRTSTTISRIIPASSDEFLEWIFLVRAKTRADDVGDASFQQRESPFHRD
jgi:hypothetical protein